MKRILFCLIIIISGLIFIMPCAAYSTGSDLSPTVYIESDKERVFVGDVVTYSFHIANAPKVVALSISPSFDSGVFEVVEAKWLMRAASQSIDGDTCSATSFWFGLADVNTAVYSVTLRAISPTESTVIDCVASLQGEDDTFYAAVTPISFFVIQCDHSDSRYISVTSESHLLVCNDCDYTVESAHQLLPGDAVGADCLNDGYTPYLCVYCDYSEERDVVKTDGHISGEWTIVDHPSIGSEGLRQKVCVVCGEVTESEVIPELEPGPEPVCEHNRVAYSDIGDGYHRLECIDCDYACDAEHSYLSELLYDESGHYRICNDCGNKSETIEHTLVDTGEVKENKHAFVCVECGFEETVAEPDSSHPIPDDSNGANDKTENDNYGSNDSSSDKYENEALFKAIEWTGNLLLAVDAVLLLILAIRVALCGLSALTNRRKR